MPTKKTDSSPFNPARQAAAGKGMPEKTPIPQRSRPGKQTTAADGSAESSLSLPHERDQSTDMTSDATNPEVMQAARDLQKGIKDTSNAPEMDQAYKKLKP